MSRTKTGWTAVGATLALMAALVPGTMGCGPKTDKAPEAAQPTVVDVTVDGTGFHPDRIAAKAGQPVTLALTRTSDETCATEIVIPAMNIDTKLPLNERVEVTVTPGAKGEIAFACGMDMFKGTIVAD